MNVSSTTAFCVPKISKSTFNNGIYQQASAYSANKQTNSISFGCFPKPPIARLITLNSNALKQIEKNSYHYVSKANKVQAYRFNPNGTDEEILKNNPHAFQGDDGKFYIPNKWNSNEPYVIDGSKEQMIMIYGDDDFAVCDGEVFEGSYVDTELFEQGTLEYQSPKNLEYGKIVNVTKQAPGSFAVLPVGTKVETLEGIRTIDKGQVLTFDHKKNPYIQNADRVLSRNEGFSDEAITLLKKIISGS